MFRSQNGITPDNATMGTFVSTVLESAIAEFRLTSADEIFRATASQWCMRLTRVKQITDVILDID